MKKTYLWTPVFLFLCAQGMHADIGETPLVKKWHLEYSLGVLSSGTTFTVLRGDFRRAQGSDKGVLHEITLSRVLCNPEWQSASRTFHPLIKIPLTLGVVDENGRNPYFMSSSGLAFTWVDFPWNKYIQTKATITGGFFFSDEIVGIDQTKHPLSDRSRIKFYGALDLSLALPDLPDVELSLFNRHASGGYNIFDKGGFDWWGVGIRFCF